MKFNHIGIMVPDISKAVKFYTQALGMKIIMNKTPIIEEEKTAIGRMCIAVFGKGFESFDIAHLMSDEGIGIELFSMKNKKEKIHQVDFNKIGIFHYCLQTNDFEGTINKVIDLGGKVRMDIMEYHPEDYTKKQKMVYLEDPFGNLFELYSHTYEETYSSKYE